MRQFDKYLQKRMKDPDFCQAFKDNCNICQIVWEIVDKIISSGKSYADIAHETGISEQDLIDFAEGDNCQSQIITTLCIKYNINLPATCTRFIF